ncbi:MAG: thiamine phosphate synthase [Myxococcales bacterium]
MTELYVIIDPEHCAERDPLWVAEQALRGGCALLQLRSKVQPDRDRLRLAQALRELTRAHRVPFWVNDRADLALLVEADGLHLGQDDLPPAAARRLVGPTMRLGLSTHSLAQAQAASELDVDLLGFGPLFNTTSKAKPDPKVGPAGLEQVLRAITKPVVAIGGIKLENITPVAHLAPAYVAVIGAVCGAPDPEAAARDLVRVLRGSAAQAQ